MEYTEEQKAAFKQQFAERRKRQIVLAVPLVVLFVAFAILSDDKGSGILGLPMTVAGPVFAVFVIGAVAFSLWNWRCPACNRYLGKGASPRFCAKCGVPLR